MVKKVAKIVKKYKATEGSPFNKDRVQVYGECLAKISQKHNGTLRPKAVVEEARNPKNPLHEVFDWDDTTAAEKYRHTQARNLINHITVEITYDNETKDWKGWFSLDTSEDDEKMNKVYVTVDRVISEPKLRQQVLLNAIEEVEYWRERYYQYKEFNDIFVSITKTKKALKKVSKEKTKKVVKKKVAKKVTKKKK